MEKFKVMIMMNLDVVIDVVAESEGDAEEQVKKDAQGMQGRIQARFPYSELSIIDVSVVKP